MTFDVTNNEGNEYRWKWGLFPSSQANPLQDQFPVFILVHIWIHHKGLCQSGWRWSCWLLRCCAALLTSLFDGGPGQLWEELSALIPHLKNIYHNWMSQKNTGSCDWFNLQATPATYVACCLVCLLQACMGEVSHWFFMSLSCALWLAFLPFLISLRIWEDGLENNHQTMDHTGFEKGFIYIQLGACKKGLENSFDIEVLDWYLRQW